MFMKFLFASILFAQVSLFADPAQIEALERKRWEYLKKQNWKELDNMIAPYFQAAYYGGGRSKEQFMVEIKSLNIGSYTLDNFIITEGPGIAVATYDVSVDETVEGKRLASKATRMTVWQNNANKWLMVAHAVLIPVPAATKK